MKCILLSETELDILQILWEEKKGLSRPEILTRLEGKAWNPNSIHQVLNSMMKKGVLQVDGMARCGKVYGRTYSPTLTQQEFWRAVHRKLCRVFLPENGFWESLRH